MLTRQNLCIEIMVSRSKALNLLNNPRRLLLILEMFQSEVRDLQNPPTVNQTVAGLQVPVVLEGGLVEVTHPPHDVSHQTC